MHAYIADRGERNALFEFMLHTHTRTHTYIYTGSCKERNTLLCISYEHTPTHTYKNTYIGVDEERAP